MKKLPLGKQTFKDLIEENNLYVDKTKYIYNLLNDNGKYFFLSRPRRFGKSLLISTLEEIFLGSQELFKGLYIYDKIEWKKYPIIRIDFTSLIYARGIDEFIKSFDNLIINYSQKFDIKLKSNNYKESFKELLEKLSEKDKTIILIDEYDKPILEFIEDSQKRELMKDIIKDFYLILKESDRYINFAFITGVSKFAKSISFFRIK
jgi:hypothetical protein